MKEKAFVRQKHRLAISLNLDAIVKGCFAGSNETFTNKLTKNEI